MSLPQIILLIIALIYAVSIAVLIYSIKTAVFIPDECDGEFTELRNNNDNETINE